MYSERSPDLPPVYVEAEDSGVLPRMTDAPTGEFGTVLARLKIDGAGVPGRSPHCGWRDLVTSTFLFKFSSLRDRNGNPFLGSPVVPSHSDISKTSPCDLFSAKFCMMGSSQAVCGGREGRGRQTLTAPTT